MKAIRRQLEACHFRTEIFDAGDTFLNALPYAAFSCVLLDLHMLGCTGWDVHEKMAAEYSATPIIFITGDGDPAVSRRVEGTAAAALLCKPFNEQQLLDAIAEAVGEHAICCPQ